MVWRSPITVGPMRGEPVCPTLFQFNARECRRAGASDIMAIDNTSHDRLERSVAELDLDALTAERRRSNPMQPYFPSPPAWADQVLYFALVDRFSDGNEQGTTVDSAGETRPTYRDNDGRPVAGGA